VDDLRSDALGCTGHPFVKTPNIDRVRNEGALFKNAFVTTSLCSPSRGSFLTGTYAHVHGVLGQDRVPGLANQYGVSDPDWSKTPSFAQLLQRAGYETAYVGKWHMDPKADPRPGFDYWLSFKGQGVYVNPELNENGRTFTAEGYLTELLNEQALKFLGRKHDKPFLLYLSHKAVHGPRTIRPADDDLYSGAEWPKPESADDDLRGKPRWQRAHVSVKAKSQLPGDVPDALPPAKWDPKNKNRIDYLRLLTSVDEGVGRILALLEEQGQLDNTIFIFAGDNGYFMGEHRFGDKRLMYEESIRIPFLMRYPPLAKAGATIDQMALNIDLAPTLLDLAGAPPASHMQGRSLRPLLEGKTGGWRKSFLYEYWLDLKPTIPDMVGVRTEDWKLVRYPNINDIDEMYDLKTDPHEMHNLFQDPRYAAKLEELTAELNRLMQESGYIASSSPAKAN
jgi:N-acetylglucosamine-6-sulfatase